MVFEGKPDWQARNDRAVGQGLVCDVCQDGGDGLEKEVGSDTAARNWH